MEEAIDIPIFVLTEQTQPHITDIKHKYNLAGSELWGMCRCLVRERTYSNVRLVDFTEDTLGTFLTVSAPSFIGIGREISISEFLCWVITEIHEIDVVCKTPSKIHGCK
jgi:hypothetical protein